MSLLTLVERDGPLLVNFPHSGIEVPASIEASFTAAGRALPDTDWLLPELYDFLADWPVTTLTANYSRYVIDLNRSSSGDALYPGGSETELCPTTTFDHQAIYRRGLAPSMQQAARRVETYWQPFHNTLIAQLSRIKARYGYALLWDAHSIASRVPRFFTGRLADLNLGTDDGKSCDEQTAQRVFSSITQSDYSTVRDQRFKGGYITRHYGCPKSHVHALQMEISQRAYLRVFDQSGYHTDAARRLQKTLKLALGTLLDSAFRSA